MSFNDALARLSAYYVTTGCPLRAVIGLSEAVEQKEKDPRADISRQVDFSLLICDAVESTTKPWDEIDERKVLENSALFSGIREALRDKSASERQEWITRCSEVHLFVEKLNQGETSSNLLKKIAQYFLELSKLAKEQLSEDYAYAKEAVTGYVRA